MRDYTVKHAIVIALCLALGGVETFAITDAPSAADRGRFARAGTVPGTLEEGGRAVELDRDTSTASRHAVATIPSGAERYRAHELAAISR